MAAAFPFRLSMHRALGAINFPYLPSHLNRLAWRLLFDSDSGEFMPIINCPECDKKLKVPENLLGKKVKCPGCAGMFVAEDEDDFDEDDAPSPKAKPREEATPPKSAGRKSVVPPPVKEGFEDEESHTRRKRARDLDDDDEDDRPRSRRGRGDEFTDAPRSKRGRDYQDDEDYDDESYEDEEEYVDRGISRDTRARWQKVRQGVTFYLTSIFAQIGLVILTACLMMIVFGAAFGSLAKSKSANQAVGAAETAGWGVIAVSLFSWVAGLALGGLRIYGTGLCMTVPPKRGSLIKGLAIATFGLTIASVVGNYGSTVIQWISIGFAGAGAGASPFAGLGGLGAAVILAGAGLIAGIAGIFTFTFFLRSAAYHIKDKGLYKQITIFLICSGVLAGLVLLVWLLMFLFVGMAFSGLFSAASGNSAGSETAGAIGAGAGMGVCLFSGLAMLGMLGLFIWFIVILFIVRNSIDRYLRRA
jgi:hypothetical protein